MLWIRDSALHGPLWVADGYLRPGQKGLVDRAYSLQVHYLRVVVTRVMCGTANRYQFESCVDVEPGELEGLLVSSLAFQSFGLAYTVRSNGSSFFTTSRPLDVVVGDVVDFTIPLSFPEVAQVYYLARGGWGCASPRRVP